MVRFGLFVLLIVAGGILIAETTSWLTAVGVLATLAAHQVERHWRG